MAIRCSNRQMQDSLHSVNDILRAESVRQQLRQRSEQWQNTAGRTPIWLLMSAICSNRQMQDSLHSVNDILRAELGRQHCASGVSNAVAGAACASAEGGNPFATLSQEVQMQGSAMEWD